MRSTAILLAWMIRRLLALLLLAALPPHVSAQTATAANIDPRVQAAAQRDLRFLLDVGALEDHATMGGSGLDERPPAEPIHFIFFGRDHERIAERSFLENENVAGAQLVYTWRELEPERDRYRLQPLLDDVAFLERHGKRLFVQLQDVSFSEAVPVPAYLLADPAFGGGAARKYEGDDGSQPPRFDGWVARRWDPAVRARFAKLLEALGKALDGRIEGINLAETAISFGESGKLNPPGFSAESYVEGVKQNMSAARKAFPRSCVIEYANFMPGEWLPGADHGYLRAVYAHAAAIGVGVGGPDVLPHRRGQRNHSYPLIAARDPAVPAGIAVQDGNLEEKNPDTGQPVTVAELYDFATNRLHVDYIFWGTQEPYYAGAVLPFLRARPPRPAQTPRACSSPPASARRPATAPMNRGGER